MNRSAGKHPLRLAREAAGMSRAELARLVGCHETKIQKLESGLQRFSDYWANRIAPKLGCRPADLFPGSASQMATYLIPLQNELERLDETQRNFVISQALQSAKMLRVADKTPSGVRLSKQQQILKKPASGRH